MEVSYSQWKQAEKRHKAAESGTDPTSESSRQPKKDAGTKDKLESTMQNIKSNLNEVGNIFRSKIEKGLAVPRVRGGGRGAPDPVRMMRPKGF